MTDPGVDFARPACAFRALLTSPHPAILGSSGGMNSNQKGDIAEAEIAACAIREGCIVARPLTDHPPYDLVLEVGRRLMRVQCKWAALRRDVIEIRIARCSYSPTKGYVRSIYRPDEIDAIAAYCEKLDQCYLVPIEVLDGQNWLSLRLSPPKNGQKAAIHFATEYELPGAVAQLGRASGWQPGGRGFESHQLHSESQEQEPGGEPIVGAHLFREHFGYWMERAAAGEEILITRRGRRYARLAPADPVLITEAVCRAQRGPSGRGRGPGRRQDGSAWAGAGAPAGGRPRS